MKNDQLSHPVGTKSFHATGCNGIDKVDRIVLEKDRFASQQKFFARRTETLGLSRLRRRVAETGRRCIGDVGVRPGMLSGDSSCAPEAELPRLRTGGASGGTEPADCAWTGGTRSAGTCIDLKICGSSSPLPAMRNL